MLANTIKASDVKKMFLAGASNLNAKKEWINELNVFPVPDGDTGTNMTMTIMSAAKDVKNLPEDVDMGSLCKSIYSGAMRGARGNSGVILSQLLRGFTKGVRDYDELDASIIANAFDKAVETAYKAVMKPKEGTILTVAKGAAEKAMELAKEGAEDLEPFFEEIIKYGDEVLNKTPEMLPVLKQAGVVDSGGQGLMQVLKGALDAYLGKKIDYTIDEAAATPVASKAQATAEVDIKFGYCTEFIVLLSKPLNVKQEIDFKAFLESIGDSIVMVADDEICKVHVHSNDPGLAIQRALMYGQLSNMKIDNMRMEHREKLFHETQNGVYAEIDTEINGAAESTPTYNRDDDIPLKDQTPVSEKKAEPEFVNSEHKDIGFVAVCAGDGLAEIFRGLGVDYVIEGGQTMNPSTEDILDAASRVNADTVFVLPNNKNIILAANQAKIMMEDKGDNKKIVVIPTKTVPQGITAAINFMPGTSVEENEEGMKEAISTVKTGEVTYAVRDTMIDDVTIKQGDYMGIGDNGILGVGSDIEDVTAMMIDKIVDDSTELISLFYGSDIKEEEAAALSDRISAKFSGCDVEVQYGGQPIYYYIVSAE
ncbi:DAK2 domain-containing protein [Butyrivibrio sp. INlla16]|uniref:DAK2 domain-containing protein n=1 Tax=Butyrivibrio sp. INlla16 TaxID=1520807 RepID=UPI000B85BE92